MQFGATPAQATILGQVPTISQDAFTQIFTQTIPSDYPHVQAGGNLPVVDTSKYQSIILSVNADGLNADFPLNIPGITVTWFGGPSNLFSPTGYDKFGIRVPFGGQGTGVGSTPTIITLPCKGASMVVGVPALAGAPADVILDVAVFGSYRSLKAQYEETSILEWGNSGQGSVSGSAAENFVEWNFGNAAINANATERPPIRSGPATLFIELASSTISGVSPTVRLWDEISGLPIAGVFGANAAPGDYAIPLNLPRRPMRFVVTNNGVSVVSGRMGLTFDEAR